MAKIINLEYERSRRLGSEEPVNPIFENYEAEVAPGVSSMMADPNFRSRFFSSKFDVSRLLEIDRGRVYLGVCHVDDFPDLEDLLKEREGFEKVKLTVAFDEHGDPMQDWVMVYIDGGYEK